VYVAQGGQFAASASALRRMPKATYEWLLRQLEEGHDEVGLLTPDEEKASSYRQNAPLPGGMCSCFSIDFYRPYFDVDTDDVVKRVKAAVFFFTPGGTPFVELIANGRSDAYGPFWIATTLVFIVSVTSHIQALMQFSGDVFEYDFKAVTFSAMVVYSYLACTTVFLWLALTYALKIAMRLLDVGCIIGYSLIAYLPAAGLCVIPYMRWPAILAATVASTLFCLRAFLPVVDAQSNQGKGVFFGVYGVCNVIFMLCLGFVYV